MSDDFTHFDAQGQAVMVDIAGKQNSQREACAQGFVEINSQTAQLIATGGVKKGDVFSIARLAGIMGAKKTAELIPLCHPLMLTSVQVSLHLERSCVRVQAITKVQGKTGVEMEALSAVCIACLTVYDMCKAVQKDMRITQVRLLEKKGGSSGDYHCDSL